LAENEMKIRKETERQGMFTRRTIMLVSALIFAFANASRADDSGWWNPFASSKQSEKVESRTATPAKKAAAAKGKQKAAPVKAPSMSSKIAKTTKSWWEKTCEILAPYPSDAGDGWQPATTGEWQDGQRIKH
jgi:hypothetical protein